MVDQLTKGRHMLETCDRSCIKPFTWIAGDYNAFRKKKELWIGHTCKTLWHFRRLLQKGDVHCELWQWIDKRYKSKNTRTYVLCMVHCVCLRFCFLLLSRIFFTSKDKNQWYFWITKLLSIWYSKPRFRLVVWSLSALIWLL